MSKTIKMKMKDILNRTNAIMRENDIIYICHDLKVISNFIKKFRDGNDNREEVRQFLIDNEEHIDKEKFILLTVKNYKENIALLEGHIRRVAEKSPDKNTPEYYAHLSSMKVQLHQQQENLKEAINLGKGIETILPSYYYDEEQKRYRVQVTDSREVIDGKKINISKATKRFDDLDLRFKGGDSEEELGLEYVLQSMLLTDLFNVFPEEELGNEIRTMILENQAIEKGIKTREEIEKLKNLELYEEYAELIDGIEFEGLLPYIKNTLREYAQYIDLDKLLLTSAYRFYEALENEKLTPKMYLGIREILQGIASNIKSVNAQISCQLQDKVNRTYELKPVTYSIKDLRECISHFVGDTYLSSKQIQEYREQVYSGEFNLLDIPSEYIDIIFSSSELNKLSTSSSENLIYVFQKQDWDTSRIIELYEADSISLEVLKQIKEHIDLSGSIDFERLNAYYKLSKENPENEEASIKYTKYLSLYKELFINDKEEQEINLASSQVMEMLVENLNGQEYDEAVKEYLKNGLLTIETVTEWNNDTFITQLFNEGLISLEDMQQLVKEQKIQPKCLNQIYKELISNEELEYNERLELIRSGFVEEKDIFDLYKRNLLFEHDLAQLAEDGFVGSKATQRLINNRTLEELEKNSAIKLTGLNSLTKKNNEVYSSKSSSNAEQCEMKSTGKFIIDPNAREMFIRLLRAYKANTDLNEDSPFYNYEFYVIPDESGEIGINSVVIAERYFEDKHTESKFATDNATYFFKYKDLMVLGNLKKSEMTKERKDIVFTANHVIANDKREGRWAKSVISSLAKTMMSCDLKEYSKKNQQIIVRQKLKQIYAPQELKDILDMATDIDFGEYIGEIEAPVEKGSNKRNTGTIVSTDDEGR